MNDEHIKRLKEIDMVWNPNQLAWRTGYEHAKAYSMILGSKKWSSSYVSPDGYKNGQWIRGQARLFTNGNLDHERKEMLAKIGVSIATDKKAGAIHAEGTMTENNRSTVI